MGRGYTAVPGDSRIEESTGTIPHVKQIGRPFCKGNPYVRKWSHIARGVSDRPVSRTQVRGSCPTSVPCGLERPWVTMSVHHQGFPIRDQDEIPLLQRVVRKCGGALILVYLVALGPLAPSYWPILFSSLLLWTSPMYMRRIFDFSLASWMHVVAVSSGSVWASHWVLAT